MNLFCEYLSYISGPLWYFTPSQTKNPICGDFTETTSSSYSMAWQYPRTQRILWLHKYTTPKHQIHCNIQYWFEIHTLFGHDCSHWQQWLHKFCNLPGLITSTKNVQNIFQYNFCDQWSNSFSLKSDYQIPLTWSKYYRWSPTLWKIL